MTTSIAPPAEDEPDADVPAGRRRALLAGAMALLVLLVGGGIGLVAHVRSGSSSAQWHTVFEDDFSGGGINASAWNVRSDTYNGNERSILTARPQNVRVGNGLLTIEARRETRTVGHTTRPYTSGYLDTIGKGSWRYGRFEVRAKLPTSAGLWPAFWLRADQGLGEVDIMEAIGGMPNFTQQTVLQSTMGDQAKFVHKQTLSTSTAQWHVYAADVEANLITWSIDGKTVYTVGTKQAPWLAQAVSSPLNIRLNLQVGGVLPDYYGHPVTSASALPAAYQVDWVRVSQHS